MKVKTMKDEEGNVVTSQIIIHDDDNNEFFQSFDKIVAKKGQSGKVYLDKHWTFEGVLAKHFLTLFLEETAEKIEEKIHSGEYSLANLN